MQVEHLDETTVITLESELDASTAPRVKEELESLLAATNGRVVLDLSGVDFIDSAGLGVLVSLLKVLRARGGDIRLAGLRKPVEMIFRLTRLDRVFKIFGDRGEAIESFAGARRDPPERGGS